MATPKTQRERYLDGEITHREYYGMIVEALGEAGLRRALPVTIEHIRECLKSDEHLNNIPLEKWDGCNQYVLSIPRPKGFHDITGSRFWSMSDTVCTMKECARRWAGTV